MSTDPYNRDPVEAWDSSNDERRAFLIDKELSQGLNPEEERELKQLQDAADSYLDRFKPLPLVDLSWLEERVRQLKLEAEKGSTPTEPKGPSDERTEEV